MSVFVDQVRAWADKTRTRIDAVVQDTTVQVATALVERTPVDTGALRANWQFSVSTLPGDTLPSAFDKEGQETISALTSLIRQTPAGSVTYLINNLPYMPTIEYGLYPNPPRSQTGKTVNGFSTQAPNGVRDITVIDFPNFVKTAIAQALA